MKKNISINISGIVFYIEEDGYETLRRYLDSVAKYFSTFEGSKEIVDDIENRMAEIFSSKINAGKQVITAEDVQSLIRTIGSIKDFQESGEEAKDRREQSENKEQKKKFENRKLFRDEKRKILGGVCAGLGHYFNVDPLGFRIGLVLLSLAWGMGVLIYFLLWILLPASHTLNEVTTRRFFRNPDGKILGGVAGGLAAYMGIDPMVMRLIFIASIFPAGLGVLIYILCWICMPMAVTITDKVNMKGQPVTLDNIESSIKNMMRESDKKEESTLAAVILFPFRLVAAVLRGIGKILGPLFIGLVEVVRIFTGFLVAVLGLTTMVAILIVIAVLLGLLSPFSFDYGCFTAVGFPFQQLANVVGVWSIFLAAMTVFIPALLVFLLGLSILLKRLVFTAPAGWVLAGLLIICMVCLAVLILRMVMNFKETGEYVIEKTFDLGKNITTFKINEIGLDDYKALEISFSGYEGNKIKLSQRFEAKGSTRKEAGENAKSVTYTIAQQDSLLILDSNLTFPKEGRFNAQQLHMEFKLPYRIKFRLPKEMQRYISHSRDEMSEHDYDIFEMTESGLICVTCENPEVMIPDDSSLTGFKDFKDILLSGVFRVKIVQGNSFQLSTKGNRKNYYILSMDEETLRVSSPKGAEGLIRRPELVITMPLIEEINVTGVGELDISGFDLEYLDWQLSGMVNATFSGNVKSMDLQSHGVSTVKLKGKGEYLEADIHGTSALKAYEYRTQSAALEVHGVSSAEVFVVQELKFEKGRACSVKYKGSPSVTE